MSEGPKTTFEVLAATESDAATRVLIPALDSPYRAIREGAFQAALARRSPAGHREIIARFHVLTAPQQQAVEEHAAGMTPALRDAVLSGDAQTCVNGCRAAVLCRQHDLIPTLLNALEDSANPNAAVVGQTLLELVQLLCAEMASPQDDKTRHDPHMVRRQVVGSLELSVSRFAKHRRREVVEAFVLVAHRDNAVLRQILENPRHPAFVILVELLSKGTRLSIIRLLLSCLDDPKAPSAVVSLVAKRADPEFVGYFLRKIGREPSAAVAHNLKRIDSLAWVQRSSQLLAGLDDLAQHAAVRLVTLSGIPRPQAFSVIEHVLLHGKPGGRRAAAEALEGFYGAEANALALKALHDGDGEVQARILVQLRHRGLPGALALLIEALDSPHAVVRKAARTSLAEFNFPRFLAAFDLLSDEVRVSTGELVKKVDPQTVLLLRAEMTSRVRRRRLRSLAIARTLDLVGPLEGSILHLLEDEDHLVRAEAAAALSKSRSPASHDALCEALGDRSPTVREAARKSLDQWARSAPAMPLVPLAVLPEEIEELRR